MANATHKVCGFLDRLRSPDLTARREAFRELVAHDRDEALAGLMLIVEKVHPGARHHIVSVLSRAGCPEWVSSLCRLAMDDDEDVRVAAYTALGLMCEEPEACSLFVGLDDPKAAVRDAAMGALALIGGTQVVAKFAADLYHQNPDRRKLAVKALGLIGGAEVIDPLVRAANYPESEIRKEAASALIRMQRKKATNKKGAH